MLLALPATRVCPVTTEGNGGELLRALMIVQESINSEFKELGIITDSDHPYKRLFSHKEMMADLISGFLNQEFGLFADYCGLNWEQVIIWLSGV